MRKLIAIMLIIALVLPSIAADPISYEYEPYTEEEFPIWSHEIRRAESLFFGSFVLTYPLAMGIYSLAGNFGANIPSGTDRALQQLGVAACFSLAIAGIDWIIGRVSK